MASGRGGGRSSSSRSSSSRSSSSRSSRSSFRSSRTGGSGYRGGYGGFGISIGNVGLIGVVMGIMFIIFPLFAGGIMVLSFLPDFIGTPSYEDSDFQDYCHEIYYDEFSNYGATEDYLLLVIATEDFNYYDYYYMAFAGDHISSDVRNMLGDNYSELGRAFSTYINSSSYKYSLDVDIVAALNKVSNTISSRNDIYTCKENHSQYQSRFENRTSIELDAEQLNQATKSFTDKTGIPILLIVDEINNVYEIVHSAEAIIAPIFIIIMVSVFVGSGIFMLVKSLKNMKKNKTKEKTTANIGESSSNSSNTEEVDEFKIDPNDY